ncbi:MAG: FadR family transcriptional regulator [Clostridia bacterium]|nr:FadR family transcriptional regulator [Clostridia bacterium]
MKLEQLTAPSLKDLFVKTVQDAIISGELQIGELLPTEREFAERMHVSRSVVNAGLNELQSRGFIEIKPRKGAVVADYIYTGNINTLNALMEYKGIAFTKESVRSILEIRKFAELMVVERICDRVTDEDLDVLGKLLGDMSGAKTPEEAAQIAFDFWHELAYRSGDIIVPLGVQSFKAPVITLWERYCRKYGIREMVENNRRLYDYIAARDVVSARACVIDYMDKTIEGDLEIYDQ